MMQKYLLMAGFFLFALSHGKASVVPSTITQDTVLADTLGPWIVSSNVTIASGVTLTLDTNVVLQFNSARQMTISSGATLVGYRATITSSSSSPSAGSWNRLLNRGDLFLDDCIIEYGSDAITLDGGSSSITNCTISSNEIPIRIDDHGDYFFDQSNIFLNNDFDAIFHYYSSLVNNSYDLYPANVPYYMINGFTVDELSFLYVYDGTVIKLYDDAIEVHGGMDAIGNAANKVIFTSWRDDNAIGDSNNDGSSSAPAAGDWDAIRIHSTAVATLDYCEISHAGRSNYFGGVICDGSDPTISNCEFISNNFCGLRMINGATPNVSNNTFSTSTIVPVAMTLDCEPSFVNNILSGSSNQYEAIGIIGSTLTQHATISQRDFTTIPNITYVVLADAFIPQGVTLTIDPGVVIKVVDNAHILVAGNLQAIGTAAEPIIFTGIADDSHGNPLDTEEDGNANVPQKSDWDGLVFLENSSSLSQMTYCEVDYAGTSYKYLDQVSPLPDYSTLHSGIAVINSDPTLTNCKIFNSHYGVTCYESAAPTISQLEIGNTTSVPIGVTADAAPTISDITFTNVGLSALGLIGNDVYNSGTISKFDMGGFTNITYVLVGDDLTIRPPANIQVDPGVVFKAFNRGFRIYGGFQVNGTGSEPVIFTSSRDDNEGRPMDTNGDGNSSTPDVGDWDGIVYFESANDVFNSLSHFQIKFAEVNMGSLASSRAGIEFQSAGGTVSHANIINCERGIAFTGTSSATADQLTIQNSSEDPVVMSLVSNPTLSNFTFTNVGYNTIGIIDKDLNQNASIGPRDLAGFSPIAYRQIQDDLDINNSATLTILPGTVWKMPNASGSARINVYGALIADGTSAEPIIITYIDDDSAGGDSGADGNSSQPTPGDWDAIRFWPSSDDTKNLLRYCQIRYGGNFNRFGNFSTSPINLHRNYESDGLVNVKNAKVRIENCELSFSGSTGLGIYGSANPDVINCSFVNTSEAPIEMAMFAAPTFSGNTVTNVGRVSIDLLAEIYSQDATLIQRDFAGYQNITYTTFFPLVVASGTHITVPAGTVIKNRGTNGGTSVSGSFIFDVLGRLSIEGAATDPVVLTNINDDDHGNPKDTRQDGATTLNISNWTHRHVVFREQSDDQSLIQNALIRYAGYAVECQSASPTIDQCEFEQFNRAGLYLTGISEPTLTNCSFANGVQVPLLTNTLSYIDTIHSTGNSISGSTWRGIGLEEETLVQDTRLRKRTFAGISAIPYILMGNLEIGTSAILTLDPGLILKMEDSNTEIIVRKGLIAEGGDRPEEKIVLTGLDDDLYGGDTDGNGSVEWPTSSFSDSWEGITFRNESIDANCRLRNVILRDADRAVYCESASPSIDKVLFQYHDEGVVCVGASNPVVDSCDFQDIRFSAVYNTNPSFTIKAENCYWNDCSGPTHATNPGGTGENVTNYVDFDPWVCEVQNAVFGDVSRNGFVQSFDAALVLQHIAGLITLDAEQIHLGDVSGTAGLSAFDASLILQYVVGIIQNFPAELLLRESFNPIPSEVVVQGMDQVVQPGDTVSIPLYLTNVENVFALDIQLSVPQDLLTLIDVDLSQTDYPSMQHVNASTKGQLRLLAAGTKALAHDGLYGNLKFKVSEEASPQEVELAFTKAWANETDIASFARPATITIEETTTKSHNALSVMEKVKAWPNPCHEHLMIRVPAPLDDAMELQIRNVYGAIVWERTLAASSSEQYLFVEEVSALPAGMYYLQCYMAGQVRSIPIIRQ